MSDTAHGEPAGTPLQQPGSDLHPADPADDLTGNAEVDPEAGAEPGDEAPSGSGARWPGSDDVDVVRTAVRGREADAAEADLADDAPRPRETPAG